MINYSGLEKFIIGDLLKKNPKENWGYDIKDEKIYFTNGIYVWIIPKDKFYLDLERFKRFEGFIDKYIPDTDLNINNVDTKHEFAEILNHPRKNNLKIAKSASYKEYFNPNYLKYFKDYKVGLFNVGAVSIVTVNDRTGVIGIIMPVRVSNEEKDEEN